jgi:hypothetical protein
MKKSIAIILAVFISFNLAACGKTNRITNQIIQEPPKQSVAEPKLSTVEYYWGKYKNYVYGTTIVAVLAGTGYVIYDQAKGLGCRLAADISEDFKNIGVVGEDEQFVSAADIGLTYSELFGKIPAGLDRKNKTWVPRDKRLKHWVNVEYNPSKTSFLDEVKPYTLNGKTVWMNVRKSLPKLESRDDIADGIIAEHNAQRRIAGIAVKVLKAMIPKKPKRSLVSMCKFSAEDCHIPINPSGDQA